jgi:hypothetical protein
MEMLIQFLFLWNNRMMSLILRLILEYSDIKDIKWETKIKTLEYFYVKKENLIYSVFNHIETDFKKLGFFGLYESQLREEFNKCSKRKKKINGILLWQQHQKNHGWISDPNQNIKLVQQHFPPNFAISLYSKQLDHDFYFLRGVISDLWIRNMLKSKEHVTLYYLDEFEILFRV